MRIVFMGTPEFAVTSLQILVENGYNVVGVITATDKMGGRGGKKLLESAVKKYAVSQDIPVLQPKNLKAPAFIEELTALKADLQVVVAFRMLPEVVWDMPKLGTFNLHGSLLPKYRGAAPINWAVINGDKQTGVTTFMIRHKIDTGDVIYQEKMSIAPDASAGDVHDEMMVLGANTVLKTVKTIEKGDFELLPQNNALATKAPKIFHDTCEIDFDQNAKKVHDFIRGMSPYPTAWTSFRGTKLKVFKAEYELTEHDSLAGNYHSDMKKYLKVATPDGFINLLEVQLQGRKRMDVRSFLNGLKK